MGLPSIKLGKACCEEDELALLLLFIIFHYHSFAMEWAHVSARIRTRWFTCCIKTIQQASSQWCFQSEQQSRLYKWFFYVFRRVLDLGCYSALGHYLLHCRILVVVRIHSMNCWWFGPYIFPCSLKDLFHTIVSVKIGFHARIMQTDLISSRLSLCNGHKRHFTFIYLYFSSEIAFDNTIVIMGGWNALIGRSALG